MLAEQKYLLKYKQLVQPTVFDVLVKEYVSGDVLFEPIRNKISEKEQDELYSDIDKVGFLSNQEKLETIMALNSLLDGSLPKSEKTISRFENIFGKDFIEMIESKRLEFKKTHKME